MKYLTRSYVEWLGLEIIPIRLRRNHGYVGLCCGGTLPLPHALFAEGVSHNGALYQRESDGLAFIRID